MSLAPLIACSRLACADSTERRFRLPDAWRLCWARSWSGAREAKSYHAGLSAAQRPAQGIAGFEVVFKFSVPDPPPAGRFRSSEAQ